VLINLRKAENDDADAHHVRPIKNFQIFTGVPTIIASVADCDAKAFNYTELWK